MELQERIEIQIKELTDFLNKQKDHLATYESTLSDITNSLPEERDRALTQSMFAAAKEGNVKEVLRISELLQTPVKK